MTSRCAGNVPHKSDDVWITRCERHPSRAASSARVSRATSWSWSTVRRYHDSMTKQEQWEAAEILERLACVVAAGEVSAPSGFVGRVEGTAAALRLSGADSGSARMRS